MEVRLGSLCSGSKMLSNKVIQTLDFMLKEDFHYFENSEFKKLPF